MCVCARASYQKRPLNMLWRQQFNNNNNNNNGNLYSAVSALDCLEHKHGDFEDDSLFDW